MKAGKKMRKAGSEVKKTGKKTRKEGQKMSEAGERVTKCACNRRVILTSAIIFGRKVVTSRRLSIFVAAIAGRNHLSGEPNMPVCVAPLTLSLKKYDRHNDQHPI